MKKAIFLLIFYICSSAFAATITSVTKKSITTLPTSTKELVKPTILVKATTTTTTKKPATSTVPVKNTSEVRATSVPTSLSDKVDYQISQTRLLINITEDNRSALKRLLSLIANFHDNNVNSMTSHSDDDGIKHISHMHHINPGVHSDNDTLHVSFGTDADPSRYPWSVALRGNDRDRCGGTLIDDLHVLTAAHCIGTRTTTVSLGSHLYNGGEEARTNFYCVHNAYSSSNYYRNDIAIIRLAKPAIVRSPKRVSTINLCNRTDTSNTTMSSNTVNLWMVGWGLKNTEIEPDELQEAQVTLADRSTCKGSSRYTDMCVQSRSSTSPMGACTGDSGSGLFQQTILTDQWCVLGIASSSNTDICAETQFSTYVQANIPEYGEWFKDVLDRKKTFDDLQKLGRCKTRTWGQEFCRWYAC